MEAAKALDAMGSLPGYKVKTGDARGAYTQSLLRGADTWVILPEIRWPKLWKEVSEASCQVGLVLYGHAEAGGFWEEHCEDKHKSNVNRALQKNGSVCFGTRKHSRCLSFMYTISS